MNINPIFSPLKVSSWYEFKLLISFPNNSIDPDLDSSNPAKRCNKVVLPIPEFPIIKRFSLFLISISGNSKKTWLL